MSRPHGHRAAPWSVAAEHNLGRRDRRDIGPAYQRGGNSSPRMRPPCRSSQIGQEVQQQADGLDQMVRMAALQVTVPRPARAEAPDPSREDLSVIGDKGGDAEPTGCQHVPDDPLVVLSGAPVLIRSVMQEGARPTRSAMAASSSSDRGGARLCCGCAPEDALRRCCSVESLGLPS